ncbi:hypothetical protein AVEN_147425-1 [Araneus ventricosus]|uniref:Uncharacterized protein n=1 Tax=Araneus ventricosus TaxID=182803 RepID=A0A4Y2DNA2_ARAVE|nr:hypothetical protein AVEN_147425-1 [Araneus ventricosus]
MRTRKDIVTEKKKLLNQRKISNNIEKVINTSALADMQNLRKNMSRLLEGMTQRLSEDGSGVGNLTRSKRGHPLGFCDFSFTSCSRHRLNNFMVIVAGAWSGVLYNIYQIESKTPSSMVTITYLFLSYVKWGRGGLVVSSRPWGRRAPGPRPDSTEYPPCMGPVAR